MGVGADSVASDNAAIFAKACFGVPAYKQLVNVRDNHCLRRPRLVCVRATPLHPRYTRCGSVAPLQMTVFSNPDMSLSEG